MTLTPIRTVAAAAIAATIAATSITQASAQQFWGGPGVQALRAGIAACGGDIARHCAEIVPGGGRIAQCLADHRDAVSPPCRDAMAESTAMRSAFFACTADAQTHCGSVRPGQGRIVACLMDKKDVITPTCRDTLEDARAVFGR